MDIRYNGLYFKIVELDIINLGRRDYKSVLRYQEIMLEKRQNGIINDTLILVEHNPVITIGKRGIESNITVSRDLLDEKGIKIYEISRGGDVTYHGPGQVVGYPIIDLKKMGIGIKEYVLRIEEIFIQMLNKEFSIAAEREEGKYTGIWIGNSKITAIGIAVKKWVTMHGFAFNVSTNLDHFKWIVPCGITDREVTSLDIQTGKTNDFEQMKKMTADYFADIFGYKNVNEKEVVLEEY